MSLRGRAKRAVRSILRRRGFALVRVDEHSHHLLSRVDDRHPLPADLEQRLRGDPPRLRELRRAYATGPRDVTTHSQWQDQRVRHEIDLRWFRGDSPIMWHYLEDPRLTRLKYFTWLRHVADRDHLGLLDVLEEDGSFGCWTFDYPGWPTVSRDLLDSVGELNFLDLHLPGFGMDGYRVLDIGAGYGRLAHRMLTAFPEVADYCCCDAVAESTFLCEVHLEHRGLLPPARVVELLRVDDVLPGAGFDLAVNVHSFSECTHAAVAWWVRRLADMDVPHMLVVPNDPTELLTTEVDGSRRDFRPLLEDVGYELVVREPVLEDPAVRELVDVHDHYHLFRRP